MKKKDLKKLTQSALFLSLCSVLVILQIPIYGFLNLDFSIVALILCIRFVSYRSAFLIALIYPWFAMLSYLPADLVAVLILITLAMLVISFDYIFSKAIKTNYIAQGLLSMFFATLFFTLLNVLLFTPMYYDFNYQLIFQAFWYYFGMYFGFTYIKLAICYFIEIILYKEIFKEISDDY